MSGEPGNFQDHVTENSLETQFCDFPEVTCSQVSCERTQEISNVCFFFQVNINLDSLNQNHKRSDNLSHEIYGLIFKDLTQQMWK